MNRLGGKINQGYNLSDAIGLMQSLRKIQALYTDNMSLHQLHKTHDYIKDPKKIDGYRSLHLIYRCMNEQDTRFNGMQLELQLRTQLQHAWATAVETIDTLLGQKLKANQGDSAWNEFFKVTSAAFSCLEGESIVEDYRNSTQIDIFKAVANAEAKLKVLNTLDVLSNAIESINYIGSKAMYYLITLDTGFKSVSIRSFSEKQQLNALQEYADAEKRARAGEKCEAVLVTGPAIANLQKAYPNFFLDTTFFVNRINYIIRAIKKI